MPIPSDLIGRAREIEPLPRTAVELLGVLDDDDVDSREIAGIVERDQAMVAKVMQIAGSSYYGARRPPSTVQTAVARIGIDAVQLIAVAAHARKTLKDTEMYGLTEQELWNHSLASTVAVKEYNALFPESQLHPSASMAALVHDIGKVPLCRHLNVSHEQIWEKAAEWDVPFVEVERRLTGCDHAEVSAVITECWSFPMEVCAAVATHHDPEAEGSQLADAIVMANVVAKTVGAGVGAEGLDFEVNPDVFRRLQLTPDKFEQLCASTAWRLSNRETPV